MKIYFGKIEQFYTYRRAMLNEYFFSVEVNSEMFVAIKKALNKQGYDIGNHICWKTTDGIYYMLSDGLLYIGHNINIGNW